MHTMLIARPALWPLHTLLTELERPLPPQTPASLLASQERFEEGPDAYELSVDLPGVPMADVSLTLQDGVLQLQATRGARTMARTYRLPVAVEESAVGATLAHGVLTIRLPKPAEVQPRTVPVTAG